MAEFEPPGLAKIFFSDIQSLTLNYHTPRHIYNDPGNGFEKELIEDGKCRP